MKKTILGLCIGLMIGLSTNAFAAIGDVVEATFTKFNFVVDGEEKTLDADPLVYQGSTYLPVRTVANLVGKDVVYKADSKTIELNTPALEGAAVYDLEARKENDSMSQTLIEDKPIPDQLKEINASIERLKNKLRALELTLKSAIEGKMSEEDIQSVRDSISRTNQELAELEAKKAELEAQQ